MTDVKELQRKLAEVYRSHAASTALLTEKERKFNEENAMLIATVNGGEIAIKDLRAQISEIVLNQFLADGTRPEYPLSITVRQTPTIFDAEELKDWCLSNMPDLVIVNDKAVKDYVRREGRIAYANGEILAGFKEVPTLVAGETTLKSWLDEIEYEERDYNGNHGE